MKILLVTGFACGEEPWKRLFPRDRYPIQHLTLAKQIELKKTGDLKKLSRGVSEVILECTPDVLIVHDIGLTTGLLGFLRAKKKNPSLNTRIIFFDGAMRSFDIFKIRHPLKIQGMNAKALSNAVQNTGGEFDENLIPFINEVKALYRQVIAVSLLEKLNKLLGKSTKQHWPIGCESLIICSPNDSFTPPICMESLQDDLEPPPRMAQIHYGHFPYSVEAGSIQKLVDKFISG